MKIALEEAAKAGKQGEVPVGAVLVVDGRVVAKGHNEKEKLKDPTAHAEILVIRKAAEELGDWRLCKGDIYVTLEPCPMCVGAMIQARIKRLFFGVPDPKAGAAGTVVNLAECRDFNHQMEVLGGILEDECRLLLKEFFKERRQDSKNKK
ncbi:MAG: Cytosine/adenosine deaminase [Clostridia bacterium 41_269]|nr:MAG: Cytosine/adenosine deaminase [Clostridia bacterium 41_269]